MVEVDSGSLALRKGPAQIASGAWLRRLRSPVFLDWAAALCCVLILSLNVYRFPFLWDDFDFLGRVNAFRLQDLLPDNSIIFYRPLSREVYFWILTHLLDMSALAAHILNTAMVGGTLAILMSFVRRLAGESAALMSGLIFGCSVALPVMIGWASASQDLLCALFAMAALHAQLHGRTLRSLAFLAGALLSKETAVSIVPALMVLAAVRARGERRRQILASVAPLGVVFAWAAFHPWIRSTPVEDAVLREGPTREYLLLGGNFLPALVQGVGLTLNVPWVAGTPKWSLGLVVSAFIVSAVIVVVVQRRTRLLEGGGVNGRKAFLLGSLILVCSILMTSFALGGWSTHYVFIPALGLAMMGGVSLVRLPTSVRALPVLAFLWLGIGLRGNPLSPILPTEANFTETARAMTKVERGFKRLHPTLPPGATVYVSVQARQSGGLYRHLFRLQPLRVWYRDQSIWVLDPNRRRGKGPNEFLFWIDPNLEVYEIRLSDLFPHGPTPQISLPQYQKALRGYALGLAGAGDVDRAVFILANMPESSMEVAAFDRRTAVALFYASHRENEAMQLASRVPVFDRSRALQAVVALLAEPVTGLDLDDAAMTAFGLDPADVPSLRVVMRLLEAGGYKVAAGRFAARILTQVPADAECTAVIRRTTMHTPRDIGVPIPHDVPQ